MASIASHQLEIEWLALVLCKKIVLWRAWPTCVEDRQGERERLIVTMMGVVKPVNLRVCLWLTGSRLPQLYGATENGNGQHRPAQSSPIPAQLKSNLIALSPYILNSMKASNYLYWWWGCHWLNENGGITPNTDGKKRSSQKHNLLWRNCFVCFPA